MKNDNQQCLDCTELLQSRFADIMTMIEYASGSGIDIPQGVRESIELIRCGMPCDTDNFRRGNMLSRSLEIYSSMCKLIAPATPITIRYTASPWRKFCIALWGPLLTGLLSVLAFAVASFTQMQGGYPPNSFRLEDAHILLLLSSAGLGAAFEGLRRADKYILERTFDPRYNQTYLIRLVLGVLSGTILGLFGRDLLGAVNGYKEIGSCMFALVGGYSSEAVALIIQRVADMLVTAVRGSDAEALKVKEQAIESKAKAKNDETLRLTTNELLKAKEGAISRKDSEGTIDAIQAAIDKLTGQIR
jgi:hypothetical protein